MKRQIGRHTLLGYTAWRRRNKHQHRAIHLLPYLKAWYGGTQTVSWLYISNVFLQFHFGWLFWEGQFTWQIKPRPEQPKELRKLINA